MGLADKNFPPRRAKKEVPHVAMRHLRELSFARQKNRGCCTEMQQPLSFGFYYAAGASGAGSAGISADLRVPDISR